jgi:hypothetical protein
VVAKPPTLEAGRVQVHLSVECLLHAESGLETQEQVEGTQGDGTGVLASRRLPASRGPG